jgi:phage tail sheath protein FI
MTMLRLVIDRQCQYLAFEPHTAALRRQVARTVTALLRDLFRAGAFTGATEADAFFVRCDETVNPRSSVDVGRLVAEVGVAPASPLEYLVVRVSQDTEGQLRVEG